ncbi:MAG: FMN-binding protein, partial [Clostridia bacterium]|nr:FMN-binding protein [Clostridia bacterium]
MKKDTMKSIVVLSCICLVVAILLSGVNAITDPIIKKAAANAASSAYGDVLPGASELEEITGEFPETVKKAMKDKGGKGFVFELATKNGYTKNEIAMVLGIGADGIITKLDITVYPESKGSEADFEALFAGKTADMTDVIAGTTITSNALKAAVKDAYDVYYEYAGVEKSDEQKLADLYEVLMPEAKDKSGAFSFTAVELPTDAPASITSIYKPSTEIGYLMTAKVNDLSVALALNAFGKVYAVYDLDGNDLSSDSAYDSVKTDAENAIPSIYETNNDEILDLMIKEEVISSASDAQKVDFGTVSSRVVAVYKLKNGNAYIAKADGFGGVLTVCYVINAKGEIVNY